MKLSSLFATAGVGTLLILAGCGDSEPAVAAASPVGSAVESQAATPAPAGEFVEVKMISGRGEIFEPADITVERGEVVRFVLESGVHNVSFPASKNASGVQLPGASPYLATPGQTFDVTMDLPAGVYHYQCDPHVALGMVGTITVTD